MITTRFTRIVSLFLILFVASSIAVAQENELGTAGPDGAVTNVKFGSLVPIVRETGKITLSVDGVGTWSFVGPSSAFIHVRKPSAAATVRRAYLAAATTGFQGGRIATGDITLDGAAVNFSITTPSSIASSNSWADVTAVVKPKLDAAPAGRIFVTVFEKNSPAVDGTILAVVFDDPTQTTDNTVALFFGAQAVDGDSFSLSLANPIDKSDPKLRVEMSLGISYSSSFSGQINLVDVNGQRISSSAGNYNDGHGIAGAFLTVGDFDDSPANPANPFSTTQNSFADDELYDLRPFVNNGDTSINVFTRNPSRDDNIFFAAFFITATPIIDESISLAPLSAVNPVGTPHTNTATFQDALGRAISGRTVSFQIAKGPHAGIGGDVVTNSEGLAVFTYTGTAAGVDNIEARGIDSRGATVVSNRVVKEWFIANHAPVINECPTATTAEATSAAGAQVPLTGKVSDPDDEALVATWSVDGAESEVDNVMGFSNATTTVSLDRIIALGSHTVTLTVADDDAASVSCSTTARVQDTTPPEIQRCPAARVVVACSAPVPDVAADLAATDLVTAAQNLVITQSPAAGTVVPIGSHTITMIVRDEANNSSSCSTTFTVANDAPSASSGGPYSVNEGSSVLLNASGSDPDGDAISFAWDVDGDGAFETAGQSASFAGIEGPGTQTVTVKVTDACGLSSTSATTVDVVNVAPSIASVSGPSAPLALGTTASLAVSYADPGVLDAHECTFQWDDGSFSTVTGGAGACSATRLYASAGVYGVVVTVADDDGGSATTRFEYVVVYDPSAGFVTGGGWINSPAGTYAADPTLTGKANFGFTSKYQKGQSVPTGQTQFQFHAAKFNFQSTSYDWTVVAGAKVQYKGAGTVNGTAGYAFLLTATDGQVNGGGGIDKFRLKVWEVATEAVVYDNAIRQSDDMDEANPQAIGGGSIVIHD